MSSPGQIIGGIVGAVIGWFAGGPGGAYQGAMYGASIGMAVGGALDPPKGPVLTGPRLDDLSVQTATYGAVIPRIYGTVAVTGNVFWLENNSLKEVASSSKSGGKGGSKTTTNTFAYYATFAVGLCSCNGRPITGIRRIWIAGRLWYDAGSNDLATSIASGNNEALFTLHDGSETQLPDDRMQATLGVENTPAYRGLAYIVFKDLPLADYSNSLLGAQVKVEVVADGTLEQFSLVTQHDSEPAPKPGWAYTYSPVFMSAEHVRFFMPEWDASYPSQSNYSTYDFRVSSDQVSPSLAIATPGSNVPPNMDTDNPDIFWISAAGFFPHGTYSGTSGSVVERKGMKVGFSYPLLSLLAPNSALVEKQLTGETAAAIATDGEFCYVLRASTGTIEKYDKNLSLVASLAVPAVSPITAGTRMDVFAGGVWIFIEPPSSACPVFRVDTDLTSCVYRGELPPMSSTGTYYNVYIRAVDGIVIRAWPRSTDSTHHVQFIKFSGVTQDPVTLASIVSSEVLGCNLITEADIDVSDLTQLVRGYRVSSVAAIRAGIEPLQGAWPFDVTQSGYKIVFKPRGGASVATIKSADLDARGAGSESGISITNSREMDSVLPRRVVANYLDIEREYNTGSQADERLNTDSVNTRTVDLAIVLTASEALGVVQTLLYLYWLERYDLSFSLPSSHNNLEAGDPITVEADEATYSLRLTGVNYTQDGRLECTAKYNAPAIYVRTALGESGQSTGAALTLAGDSVYVLLDIPLATDALDTPGFPVAMAGYLSGWPGGELFRSDDGGQTWADLQGFLPPGATIGFASNAIGSTVTATIDKSSALNVSLINGDLSSVSELAMLNGANHFAYGVHGRWEIIAAQNCALQADGSYILTDLLRGRQGTDWACGLHAAGDKVVELDASALAFVGASLNSIGLSKTYRGITLGKTLDSAPDVSFTYAGVNLECLSPVYLNGNRNAANDWALTWIRRTRVGGAWRDNVDVSLGEASEAYEVDIFSDGTYATLKRTITGLASAAATYTSANQVSDFGSNQSTLYVKVYQLSANVGRGNPLTASITR